MPIESHLTRKLRFGASLGQDDAEYLDRLSELSRRIPAQTSIIEQGDVAEFLHVVKSGMACRYKIMPDGRRAILALMLPGDFCDLHVAILEYMDHSIGTLMESEICRVSRKTVEEMLQRPAINRACWWATLADEAVLREWLVNVGRRTTDQQLAHLFCELYLRFKAVGLATDHTFPMPFTQTTLGDLIGSTNVHVQRMMRKLRENNLIILENRMLTFPDFHAIVEFAEFDSGYLHYGRADREVFRTAHSRLRV